MNLTAQDARNLVEFARMVKRIPAGAPLSGDYLYHVTSTKNAGRIRREGLATSGTRRTFTNQSNPGKVFLTEAKGVPFWKQRVGEHLTHNSDDPPGVAVFRVRKVGLKLNPDAAGTKDARASAFYSEKSIPAKLQPGRVRRDLNARLEAKLLEFADKRFKKIVRNPETGRTKTVRYGQAGKADDGGDRIRPGTSKGDAYCARSAKIKGDWRSDPNSPNNLSRRKWKCKGSVSQLAARIPTRVEFARGKYASDILHTMAVPSRGSDYAKQTATRLREYRRKPLANAVLGTGGKGLRIVDRDGGTVAAFKTFTPKVKGQVLPNLEKAHARGPFEVSKNALGEALIRETKRTASNWSL